MKIISRLKALFYCEECGKSKRSFKGFMLIFAGAYLMGINTVGIYAILAVLLGYATPSVYDSHYQRLRELSQLPFIMGATAYLAWIYWQFDKVACMCDEEGRIKKSR